MSETRKYPRTLHVPFSKGLSSDDRKCEDGYRNPTDNDFTIC